MSSSTGVTKIDESEADTPGTTIRRQWEELNVTGVTPETGVRGVKTWNWDRKSLCK
jgi:hypothetical protein